MAYGTKYRIRWQSQSNARWGYVYLDKEDYTGSVTDLKMAPRDFKISRDAEDWETPILGHNCEFSILNDMDSFFDLMELMTLTEREFEVRVTVEAPTSQTIFRGYLNVDTVTQKYLNRQLLRLTASSYLSKLKHVYPSSFDTLQYMSLIDVISEILGEIGSSADVLINSTLYAKDDTIGALKTLFNVNGLYTEVFWKNNIDRFNSFEILESILRTFNCYIYWYNDAWYIERYHDIWQTGTINFIKYDTTQSYGPNDWGVIVGVSRSSSDLHDLVFSKTSQEISVIPGNKEIEVRVDTGNSLMLNLTTSSLYGATGVFGVVPYPDYRTWQYWDGGGIVWSNGGVSSKGIASSIKATMDTPGYVETHRGIYTRFKVTVGEETNLSIKYKYALIRKWLGFEGYFEEADFINTTFTFHWYLRHPSGNYFLIYDPDTDTWARQLSTEAAGMNSVDVEGSTFDKVNWMTEVEISIPLHLVTGLDEGDQDFILGICMVDVNVSTAPAYDFPANACLYGDPVIAVDGEQLAENVIRGSINSNFLNRLEFTLDLADNGNLNYKNGITRGFSLEDKTESWTMDGVTYYEIVEWFFIDKFRLYNSSKQRIDSQVIDATILPPMSLYTDSKQSNKTFVLLGYEYRPIDDEYRVSLLEYDNTTTINLI